MISYFVVFDLASILIHSTSYHKIISAQNISLDHGGSYDVNMDGTVLPTHGITNKSTHRNTNPYMLT